MRSLYFRILLAASVTAVVTLGAFMAIAGRVMRATARPLFTGAYTLQLDQAVDAYREGGPTALSAFMAKVDAAFNAEHHVVDRDGRDLVTGEDQARFLRVDPGRPNAPQWVDGRLAFVRTSSDGRYRLVAIASPPFTMWTFAPFYLLVIVTVLFLSWLVAVGIAAPIRALSDAVDQFGRGDLSAHVSYERNNEIGRLGRSFNEMTGRIQMLLKAERQLLQDISHELRSPLARLSFAAELARTAPDRNAAIDRIQKEVDRLTTLVGQLIEVTRAEGDPGSRKIDPVPVGELVREVVDECAVEADARDCRVVFEGGTSRAIRGDRELLRRAFENVVRNAIRFAPAGSAVDVTVEEQSADVIVMIRDHGPGVPPEALSSIFGAFYRVDPSRDSESGGLGLGLSIAYRAIHLHHGSIAAENDRPGLRVTVTLPYSGAA